MAATKKADRLSELGGTHGQPLSNFHAYDLNEIGIPVVARPISGQHYAGKTWIHDSLQLWSRTLVIIKG